MAALAGCMGIGGGGGQSLSDAQVDVADDGGPAVYFNYSVNDYATVLLEGPDDNVINEREVSPDGEQSALYMGDPQPGEYKLVLRQGENTVTSTTMTFEGPDPAVEDVSPNWSGNSIQSVSVTVQNDGDLPAYVDNATFSARGDVVESSVYRWLNAGESATLNISTSYGGTISIGEAGDVRGSIEVVTDEETLSGSFEKTFQGPKLSIVETNGSWNGNTLETVDVTVQNEGDLPTTANVTVERAGDVLGGAIDKRLPVGSTVTLEATSLGYIYQADSGGTASLDVVVNSPKQHVTTELTHEVTGASVAVESISPVWENGQLTSVAFTASNAGDVEADVDAQVSVNGEQVTETPLLIEPGATNEFEVGDGFGTTALYTPDDGGTYDVTLTLSGEDGTTSKSASKSYDGPDGSLSEISATFYSNYNEDTADLSSVDLSVQSTGDLPVKYDSIEVSIDGTTQTDSLSFTEELEPGQSTTEYPYFDITVPTGTHDMTVRLMNDGEAVITETTTVSTGN